MSLKVVSIAVTSPVVWLSVLVMAGPALAQAPALTQKPAVVRAPAPLRTPDGHSDLEGTWTNSTMTLLQRPMGLSRTLTEEEATKFEEAVKKDRSSDNRDG